MKPRAPEIEPGEALRRYEERMKKIEERNKSRNTPAQTQDARLKGIEKAHHARMAKLRERQLVKEKVARGEEITEDERDLLIWKAGKIPKKDQERLAVAAAAKLVIKPQTVNELRVLVEKTAARHSYNPIEALIQLTRSDEVKEVDKIGIHKALLPFLVPQLATPKAPKEEGEGGGVKVTIMHYQFPDQQAKPAQPLHTEKPATVEITDAHQ